jgi:hypothetical protein
MNRRDLLRGATLAAAAHATGSLAHAAPSETPLPAPLPKIALEEHFMVPDFMEYFAETYPNIDPELIKLAPPALMDFGERRLSAMDAHHIDYVVLSLSGPGLQMIFSLPRSRSGPRVTEASLTWPCITLPKLPPNWNGACTISAFRER